MQHRELLSTWPVPLVSLEEHQAQVQALCGLVVAMTGLPLYDLSKGRGLELDDHSNETLVLND